MVDVEYYELQVQLLCATSERGSILRESARVTAIHSRTYRSEWTKVLRIKLGR